MSLDPSISAIVPLPFELADQVQKYLVGNLSERRANAVGGGKLRDENGRLPYDCVDEKLDRHAAAANLSLN